MDLSEALKKRAVNKWGLFWLVTGPISVVMVFFLLRADLSGAEAVSSMIQLSVRCGVPLLYLTFASSSAHVLFPGLWSRWLLRNRKFMGLCFAAAMAWQALFIVWLVTIHRDYYVAEVYVLRDVIEGVGGYLFLIAMTLTSFKFGSRLLKPRQWKLLHKSGIYFLWAYAFSVYWWALFYYPSPSWIDYVFYWGGFLAWGLRAAAWSKKRRQRAEKASTSGHLAACGPTRERWNHRIRCDRGWFRFDMARAGRRAADRLRHHPASGAVPALLAVRALSAAVDHRAGRFPVGEVLGRKTEGSASRVNWW